MTNRKIKNMFKKQWTTQGNIEQYMQDVKRRVKEQFGYELEFTDADQFFDELVKYGLIQVIAKGKEK